MTISTTLSRSRRGRETRSGFTLVEVLVALALSLIVLAGVMSAFLMLGRTGMGIIQYSTSETEIRRGIEEFSQDVRMAENITWNSTTSITLRVPGNYPATGNLVTYAFDSSFTGPTARSFYRVPGGPASTAARTVYVRDISDFSYSRFNRLNVEAATNPETKRLRVTMNVRRARSTTVAANTTLVSASYTLRNKVVN
jgi:prepilin-type N-terminal cleavage/methylation domain-containing protein